MKMTIEEIKTAAVEFEMIDWEEQTVLSERSREIIAKSLECTANLIKFINDKERKKI